MPIAAYSPTLVFLGYKKSTYAMQQEILALSQAKQNAIWTAFNAVWQANDLDSCSTVILATFINTQIISVVLGLLVGQNAIRALAVALYLRDYPQWLEAPTFDATINIKGYVPV